MQITLDKLDKSYFHWLAFSAFIIWYYILMSTNILTHVICVIQV